MNNMMDHKKNALNAIGNTPLVRLEKIVPSNSAEVWVKLEGSNPTGSYKDRMALSVLTSAIERGELSPGDTVIEYTGGSTGTALAFVSAVLGIKFIAVFSDAFSKSKQLAMEAFGAKVIVIKSQDGVITPDLIQRMKVRAYEMAEKPNTYYADQFGSPEVRSGYKALGIEIAQTLDGDLDLLVVNCGEGVVLFQNDGGNQNNWLKILTIGKTSNRNGIGARIELTAGKSRQIREVISGSSYLSQSSLEIEFGLGKASVVDQIRILWPSGSKQTLTDINVNQKLVITEPDN